MITTLVELEEATAFERFALAAGIPVIVIPDSVQRASLDLRGSGTGVTIGVLATENLGARARQDLLDQLRPLLFGAAWKVIDLVIELALFGHGLAPHGGREWKIREKQNHA